MEKGVYFVSGIDTNIGKSYATGFIAKQWNEKGVRTITQKLIQTGNTDLSESVIVNSENVDTSKPGTYSVYYTVSDTGGITATEVLTVYVLESAVPRIVISGAGTTADNPLIIEQMTFDEEVGDEEKLSAAAATFEKALPVMKAYDLEDGDISYRISVTEDEAYQAVLQAVLDGTTPSDPVTR